MNNNKQPGPVMFDLRGPVLLPDEAEQLLHPAAGGIIFFTRNFESPEQLSELVKSVRNIRSGLLIAVDHEGGRVQRFRSGFTQLPAAADFRRQLSDDPHVLTTALETAGWLMAAELRAVDIDFSFAPVLDVDCGVSEIIGNRSFSRDALEAGHDAWAFARGMKKAGMAAVGKHFPGHGAVALDSHLALPVDTREYAALEQKDLLPFQLLIQHGLEGVMPAHVVYSAVDADPAGFSHYWIDRVLRGKLGFDGCVFSDDLSMEGAAVMGDYVQRADAALRAGCDMVLVCNHPEATAVVLESLESRPPPLYSHRLERMRAALPALQRQALLQSETHAKAVELIQRLQESCNA
jgi:beta-N-acetylhexosaminidase